jgi:antitoxin (DNA-binding transcriptional repressor) of toxin-antitoxin stability system
MDPITITIHEPQAELAEAFDLAAKGKEVIIANGKGTAVRLLVVLAPKTERRFGLMKGQIWVAEDFDDPLPAYTFVDAPGQ